MAYFEGAKMTAGYGDGPDIISSCSITDNRGEIVAILAVSYTHLTLPTNRED